MYTKRDEMLNMGLENKLIYAVAKNNLDEIKKRLVGISSRQLNMKYTSYENPLLIATNDNNIAVAKLLLDAGANTEIKDMSGSTPLTIALKKGYEDLTYLLIEYGANIHRKFDRKISTLHYAAIGCGSQMIEYLLNKGLEINYLSIDNLSALDFTTDIHTKGNIDAAKALVNNGISQDIITRAFFKACWRGNDKIANMLILAGADINIILGKNKRSPETLFWLCKMPTNQHRTKYLKTIRLLLIHGVNFKIDYKFTGSILNCTGSPLQKAREERFFDAVNLIQEGQW